MTSLQASLVEIPNPAGKDPSRDDDELEQSALEDRQSSKYWSRDGFSSDSIGDEYKILQRFLAF